MKLQATQDIIILRRVPQKDVSEGGVLLVESGDFTEDIGDVVASGPGKLNQKGVFIPNDIEVGQRVLFSTNGHQVTRFNGEELVITRANSIMGVINGD